MTILTYSLSVIIISNQEFNHWPELLPRVHSALEALDLSYEILVADPKLDEDDYRIIEQNRGTTVLPAIENYGFLLRSALHQAAGDYIITMDADQTQPLDFICDLWEARGAAEIVISSRYLQGGTADMPGFRRILSRLLNLVFSRGLDLQIRDMSSAFRLYNAQVVKGLLFESKGYEVLQEILVQALMMGYRVSEVPFHYQSSDPGYLRALHFGWAYVRTFSRLWRLRNSIASADYDARAYDALMPPQRYWQRQRFRIITTLIRENGMENV